MALGGFYLPLSNGPKRVQDKSIILTSLPSFASNRGVDTRFVTARSSSRLDSLPCRNCAPTSKEVLGMKYPQDGVAGRRRAVSIGLLAFSVAAALCAPSFVSAADRVVLCEEFTNFY